MQKSIKSLITLFAAGLLLWLIWGFWSLGQAISLFLSGMVIAITGTMLFWRYQQQRKTQSIEPNFIDVLPSSDYSGSVVLACGQSQALFPNQQPYRETSQGWYIAVRSPTELVNWTNIISEYAPSLLSRLSVLFVVLPEQIQNQETLTQDILGWRRAITQNKQQIGRDLPFWVSIYITPQNTPSTNITTGDDGFLWTTLLNHQHELHVEQEGAIAEPFSVWCSTQRLNNQKQLQNTLWLDILVDWLNRIFIPQLTLEQAGAAILIPSGWAIQWIAVDSHKENIWQQFLQQKTTLPLSKSTQSIELLPLPNVMLRHLQHEVSLSRGERLVGVIGLICGVFLIGALIGSYHHNRQLIRHTGDDVSRFLQLANEPLSPKLTAYQQLQEDAAQLARWQREGIPTAYSLALYQGEHILPHLYLLLSDWSPPTPTLTPSAPVIIQAEPEKVSLDSLALFDVGQYTLKPNATKVLVDALLHVRAKPGWLIMISGYTDNTGNPARNKTLSLKRAESVRDWMIETSDIHPTCFVIQGYGQQDPIADNNTPEGRARNRRVEIRLTPQAEACKASDNQTVSPMDGDTLSTLKEK